MTVPATIRQLHKARSGLVRTYVLHLAWFTAMCCSVGLASSPLGLKASVLLALVTVPPVLFYSVRVHRLCRRIDPSARTVGLIPSIIITIVLSPFESGLVLPLKNLIVANRLLRRLRSQSSSTAATVGDSP